MAFKNRYRIAAFALALCFFSGVMGVSIFAADAETEAQRFKRENESVSNFAHSVLRDDAEVYSKQRYASFESGYFYIREDYDKAGAKEIQSSYLIPGESLEIMYVDDEGKVLRKDFSKGGKLPTSSTLYLQTDRYSLYISQALQFVDTYMALHQKQGQQIPLEVKKTKGFYSISYKYQPKKNARNVQWGLVSRKPLIDIKSKDAGKILSKIDLSDKAVLIYDGYAYEHYASKKPLKTYHVIPSPYLAKAFVSKGGSKIADLMSQILLKISIEQLDKNGYFPVKSTNIWLKNNYGITTAYFDNRWCSDLVLTLMEAYVKQKDESLKAGFEQVLDYFMGYVDEHSAKVGENAYLNYDYGVDGFDLKTHSSLNHQLSVIYMFFRASQVSENPEYREYARKLVRGVESVGDRWISASGDLHYAYMASGAMGMKDYPVLTYNDLQRVQKIKLRIDGSRSKVLDKLIAQKAKWLDANGYKGKY